MTDTTFQSHQEPFHRKIKLHHADCRVCPKFIHTEGKFILLQESKVTEDGKKKVHSRTEWRQVRGLSCSLILEVLAKSSGGERGGTGSTRGPQQEVGWRMVPLTLRTSTTAFTISFTVLFFRNLDLSQESTFYYREST